MDNKPHHTIFVYGSLKSNCYNNECLTKHGGVHVGDATTKPIYSLRSFGPYPCMIEHTKTKGKPIKGELWRVPQALFEKLDRMEKQAGYKLKEIQLEGSTSVAIGWVFPNTEEVRALPNPGTCWQEKKQALVKP